MVDIPHLLKKKNQEQFEEYLMQMQLSIATNNRIMEDEKYTELIQNLTKNLENETQENTDNKLDRQAFETLRLMTSQGANFTGRR